MINWNGKIPEVIAYGTAADYCQLPSPEQACRGVIPLDSLPAAWWNKMWHDNNVALNCSRAFTNNVGQELCNIIVCRGGTINENCNSQLYSTIFAVGTADKVGMVKSSTTDGQVSIASSGVMTVNGYGNAALQTTAQTLTEAINELKSAIDNFQGVTYSDTAPLVDGTAAAGTSDTAARGDHVHPIGCCIRTPQVACIRSVRVTGDSTSGWNHLSASGSCSRNSIIVDGYYGFNHVTALGYCGYNSLCAEGPYGYNQLCTCGSCGYNLMYTAGACGYNRLCAVGDCGCNQLCTIGANGTNLLYTCGECGRNQLTVLGVRGWNRIAASGCCSYNEIHASGARGCNSICANGSYGKNLLLATGSDGSTQICATGLRGYNSLYVCNTYGFNSLCATGCRGYNYIYTEGDYGRNNIQSTGSQGYNQICATGCCGYNYLYACAYNLSCVTDVNGYNAMCATGCCGHNVMIAAGECAYNYLCAANCNVLQAGNATVGCSFTDINVQSDSCTYLNLYAATNNVRNRDPVNPLITCLGPRISLCATGSCPASAEGCICSGNALLTLEVRRPDNTYEAGDGTQASCNRTEQVGSMCFHGNYAYIGVGPVNVANTAACLPAWTAMQINLNQWDIHRSTIKAPNLNVYNGTVQAIHRLENVCVYYCCTGTCSASCYCYTLYAKYVNVNDADRIGCFSCDSCLRFFNMQRGSLWPKPGVSSWVNTGTGVLGPSSQSGTCVIEKGLFVYDAG